MKQNSLNAPGSNYGMAPGVSVEILWDIENRLESGRRKGFRSINTVWWRAQVVEITEVNSRTKVKLVYEARDGFDEQIGYVWVFPRHVKMVDDESTQLRWRFYECSGTVSYGSSTVENGDMIDRELPGDEGLHNIRLKKMEEHVADLLQKQERFERLVLAQSQIQMQLIGKDATGDRQCEKLLSTLRQKVAILLQRGIPSAKGRKDVEDSDRFFEDCSSGVLRAEVDCCLTDFESFARVVRSASNDVYFHPTYAATQFSSSAFEEAHLRFRTLTSLCEILGIHSHTDLLHTARRAKGIHGESEKQNCETALRILGTYLCDPEDSVSATAFLVCQSMDRDQLQETFNVVSRPSRDFDFASMAYQSPLSVKEMTGETLLDSIYSSRLEGLNSCQKQSTMNDIVDSLNSFAIRWKPLPAPNARLWTRPLVFSKEVCGSLEIELPYVLFRGNDSVSEISSIVDAEFFRMQLRKTPKDLNRPAEVEQHEPVGKSV